MAKRLHGLGVNSVSYKCTNVANIGAKVGHAGNSLNNLIYRKNSLGWDSWISSEARVFWRYPSQEGINAGVYQPDTEATRVNAKLAYFLATRNNTRVPDNAGDHRKLCWR